METHNHTIQLPQLPETGADGSVAERVCLALLAAGYERGYRHSIMAGTGDRIPAGQKVYDPLRVAREMYNEFVEDGGLDIIVSAYVPPAVK